MNPSPRSRGEHTSEPCGSVVPEPLASVPISSRRTPVPSYLAQAANLTVHDGHGRLQLRLVFVHLPCLQCGVERAHEDGRLLTVEPITGVAAPVLAALALPAGTGPARRQPAGATTSRSSRSTRPARSMVRGHASVPHGSPSAEEEHGSNVLTMGLWSSSGKTRTFPDIVPGVEDLLSLSRQAPPQRSCAACHDPVDTASRLPQGWHTDVPWEY